MNLQALSDPARRRWIINTIIIVLLAFALGLVVGARFVATSATVRAYLGLFLPAATRNPNLTIDVRKLTIRMTKAEVLDNSGIRRVAVYAGKDLERYRPGDLNPSVNLTEIWLLPIRSYGLSQYIYLGFDDRQRLCVFGQNELRTKDHRGLEWLMGYRADREY